MAHTSGALALDVGELKRPYPYPTTLEFYKGCKVALAEAENSMEDFLGSYCAARITGYLESAYVHGQYFQPAPVSAAGEEVDDAASRLSDAKKYLLNEYNRNTCIKAKDYPASRPLEY